MKLLFIINYINEVFDDKHYQLKTLVYIEFKTRAIIRLSLTKQHYLTKRLYKKIQKIAMLRRETASNSCGVQVEYDI